MIEFEEVIEKMDFNFFATGQHKIDPEVFLNTKDAIFLDVRSNVEFETIQFHLTHHVKSLEIPVHEIPSRIQEIPKDKCIGVFCSSGIRCTIVFLYLQSKGYTHVKILEGGYTSFMPYLMPGKILNHIKEQ